MKIVTRRLNVLLNLQYPRTPPEGRLCSQVTPPPSGGFHKLAKSLYPISAHTFDDSQALQSFATIWVVFSIHGICNCEALSKQSLRFELVPTLAETLCE